MKNFSSSSALGKFSFLLLSISLLVGFYFDEIASGIGAKADFYNYWPYVLALKEKIYVPPSEYGTLHLPLHYMILAKLNFLISDKYFLRLFFCIISIFVPFLFYLNLKVKFNFVNKNKLWFLSSLIFLFPSFNAWMTILLNKIFSILFS